MKHLEKKKARDLRKAGLSIKEIERIVGVPRSSISVWVRDIALTQEQRNVLAANSLKRDVMERRRETRMKKTADKYAVVASRAAAIIGGISQRDLLMLGVALYWGEGSKKKQGSLELANTDPRIIRLIMAFYRKILGVPDEKFRGRVYIHPHLSFAKAEAYWAAVSGIPVSQFQRAAVVISKSSKQKKDSQPHGTFTASVYDTVLKKTVEAWMETIALESATNE